MIVPDKFISFDESILSLISITLERLKNPIRLIDLLEKSKKEVTDPDQFLLLIDTLYVLGLVNVDYETEIIYLAKRN